jgi:hypothetical protein
MLRLYFEDDGRLCKDEAIFEKWFNNHYVRLPHYSDGTPVEIGDKIVNPSGKKARVCDYSIQKDCDGRLHVILNTLEEGAIFYIPVDNCINEPFERYKGPETLEDIVRDAVDNTSHFEDYFRCGDRDCKSCPHKINGQKPGDYYGVDSCDEAIIYDLIERIRKANESESNNE